MIIDQKSYELAQHFLSDKANASLPDAQSLAETIQQAVEDWFDADYWRKPHAFERGLIEPAWCAGCGRLQHAQIHWKQAGGSPAPQGKAK